MRGASVVLGSLLVATGLVGPATFLGGGSDVLGPVQGEARFPHADYSGNMTVESNEAAMRIVGEIAASVNASTATVHVITNEQTYVLRGAQGAIGKGWVTAGVRTNESRETYTDASIRVEGNQDGLLRVWPNVTGGQAQLSVNARSSQFSSVVASERGVNMTSHGGQYQYELDGPIFAIGDQEAWPGGATVAPATFSSATAKGALVLIVHRGQVTITENGERTVLSLDSRERVRDPAGAVDVSERKYAVITLERGNVSLDPGQARAAFFAHGPTWTVDGSLRFEALEGEVKRDSEKASLENDTVEIEGITRLKLDGIGENDEVNATENPLGDNRILWRPILPQAMIQSSFSANATEASVNGQPLVIPEEPAIPEEVTFWGKILGFLLLAASILKKLLGFLMPLVVDDPLDNERRSEIVAYLREVRMAHTREIGRATEIPVASLSHHLDVLRDAGLVTRVEANGYTVYFVADDAWDHEDRRRLALLVDETRRAIACLLVDRGSASQEEIAERLGLSRGAISEQLTKLAESCLVEECGGWPRVYEPSSLVRRWRSAGE